VLLHTLVIYFLIIAYCVCVSETRSHRIIRVRADFRVGMAQDVIQNQRFTIDEKETRQYRRFNAQGTQFTVHLLPPSEGEDSNPMSHFVARVTRV